MFASRREWFEHEMTFHCVNYVCIPPCPHVFDTYIEFYRHLKEGHSDGLSDEQIEVIASMRRASTFPETGMFCPLCQTHCSSSKQLEKHLGGDLEQIALFTLPLVAVSGDIDDGDDDSDNNEDDSSDGLSVASSTEMDVEEKMELLDRGKDYLTGNAASSSEIEPEHVILGIPYCRRHGQSKIDWQLRHFELDRPFSCTSLCGQHFNTKTKWKAHEELNFPRAWWICKFCADIFPRRDRLRDHKKKQHGHLKVEPNEKHNTNQRDQFSRECFFGCNYSSKVFNGLIMSDCILDMILPEGIILLN
jgi:hypothetical protein